MIKILLVDDHAVFRNGLRRLLSDEADLQVVAEASNGPQALQEARTALPDLILLDINMGGRSGLDTLKRFHVEQPRCPVIMLSMYAEAQYAPMAFKLGARGYLSKDRDAETLIAAIRIVAGGGYYLPPGVDLGMLGEAPADNAPLYRQLTEREWEVLRLIVAGTSLTLIGQRLNLSVKTISTYRRRLLHKLQVATNAELVRYCLDNGIAD